MLYRIFRDYLLSTYSHKNKMNFQVLDRIEVKNPAASNGFFDPRGSRQMDAPACPFGSLLAGIKSNKVDLRVRFDDGG